MSIPGTRDFHHGLLAPLKEVLGAIPFRHCGVEQVDWDVIFTARFASI